MSDRPLPWMPHDVPVYIQRTSAMTLLEEGAYSRAIAVAWSAPLRGAPPGTIPNDEAFFERLFGRDWPAVRETIAVHFIPDPASPDRLICVWLAELYSKQMRGYRQRSEAANASVMARKKRADEKTRRKKEQAKRKNEKGLNGTRNPMERPFEQRGNENGVGASFEKQIPSGGSASQIPPEGEAPDGAAVGRGGATSTPPSPRTEAQRPHVERPDRDFNNAPGPDPLSDLARAEALATASPDFAAAVASALQESLAQHDVTATDPRDPQVRAHRAAALVSTLDGWPPKKRHLEVMAS